MNYNKYPNDPILEEDIEYIVSKNDFSLLHNSSVFITGATGLIGSQIIKTLLFMNNKNNSNIKIYAHIRNYQKAASIFFDSVQNINFIIGDITEKIILKHDINYMIHGANITTSKAFIEKPIETIDTALYGTRNMLELAKEKKVNGFVYLSSMEVFGVTDNNLKEIRESDYGYIDILNIRSSYSESKRMCECMCSCFAIEYNMPIKIARLAQTFGAGIDYNDSRVTAQFARCVIEKKDITLKTDGKSLRPSLYTRDAVSGIFTVLLKGKNSEAYTLANRATAISIREIAFMIAEKIAHNKIKVMFNIDNKNQEYAPNYKMILNTDKIEYLGWKPEVGLEDAYRRTINSMKARKYGC
ncbi:MAG: NAD(P)-dependent oxidoreductase [Bacteroidales bacterium]|jgi:dTDP-glucose 4,6-dehydratase|nr:NAD(P)-dependent oxidoreductase [Bacteroidales bacterium]